MRILFFTPYMGRTGSELFLLSLIKYIIKNKPKWKIKIVSFNDGELIKEFPSSVEIITFNSWYKTQKTLIKQLKIKLQLRKGKTLNDIFITNVIRKNIYDIWYVNTIIPSLVLHNSLPEIPVILHIHELVNRLQNFSTRDIENITKIPDKVICVSNASKKGFEALGIKNIDIIYPSINWNKINIDTTFNLREYLKINSNKFIWGMSGTLDFNKNPILFVEILKSLIDKKINTHFIWIGGDLNTPAGIIAKNLAIKYKINNHITFIGNQTHNYYNIMAGIDGFILTSTFESFSLVTLEALYLKKIIVVRDCGGVNEIINSKIGHITSSSDPNEISKILIKYMNNRDPEPQRLKRFNKALEFDINKSNKMIIEKITELISTENRS